MCPVKENRDQENMFVGVRPTDSRIDSEVVAVPDSVLFHGIGLLTGVRTQIVKAVFNSVKIPVKYLKG